VWMPDSFRFRHNIRFYEHGTCCMWGMQDYLVSSSCCWHYVP
jgi:hypothetical protein